jgi:hypothetical protein
LDELAAKHEGTRVKIDDWDGWTEDRGYEPPQPGVVTVVINDVTNGGDFPYGGETHQWLNLTLEIAERGHASEGLFLQNVNISTMRSDYGRKVSTWEDLFHAASIPEPIDGSQWASAVADMVKHQTPFRVRIGWEGICFPCTEQAWDNEVPGVTLEEARSTKDNRTEYKQELKAANKAGRVLKSERDFPKNDDGTFNSSSVCPDCEQALRARAEVRAFLSPVEVPATA